MFAEERAITERVVVKAKIDDVWNAWSHVLANLQKRFETGPSDWTEWLKRMMDATPSPPK